MIKQFERPLLFAPMAVIITSLRYGTVGFATDTNQFVVRDLTGALHVFVVAAATDHGVLLGLADDDHIGYALLAGRAGGQTLIGDTAANGDLTLQSTSNGTRGSIICSDELIANGNSKVQASSTTARSMVSGGQTTVIFEVEALDLLGEYDNTTGVFTATYAGFYVVTWEVYSASVAWDAGEYWTAFLSRNNSVNEDMHWRGHKCIADAAITKIMSSNGVAIVNLAATDTLRIKVEHNQGAAVNTSSVQDQSYFHIARIA